LVTVFDLLDVVGKAPDVLGQVLDVVSDALEADRDAVLDTGAVSLGPNAITLDRLELDTVVVGHHSVTSSSLNNSIARWRVTTRPVRSNSWMMMLMLTCVTAKPAGHHAMRSPPRCSRPRADSRVRNMPASVGGLPPSKYSYAVMSTLLCCGMQRDALREK